MMGANWVNRSCLLLASSFTIASLLPGCLAQSQDLPNQQKPTIVPTAPLREQTIPSSPKTPLTWAQFVQQGGNGTIQVDFDLPPEFRNGPVYFNRTENEIASIILKQGLRRYPPVQDGSIQLNYEYMPLLQSRGQMMVLSWNLKKPSKPNANDTSIRYPYKNKNVACLRDVCLLALMLNKVEREHILRSQHPIQLLSR